METVIPRDWYTTDYYAELGVDANASPAEVTDAFRDIARGTHPDLRPGDDAAGERFRAASAANDVLSDPALRAAYDRTRRTVRSVSPTTPRDATATASASASTVDIGADEPVTLASATLLPDLDRTPARRALRIVGGWLLIVAAVAVTTVVVLGTASATGAGGDSTGKRITLGLVALKFLIAGILLLVYPAIRTGVNARQVRKLQAPRAAMTPPTRNLHASEPSA